MACRFAGRPSTSAVLVLLVAGCGGSSFGTAPSGEDSGADGGVDAATEASTGALKLEPTTFTFHGVPPYTQSEPFTFTVTNTGGDTTGPISVTINQPAFSVSHSDCTSLAPAAACTVDVVFNAGDKPNVDGELVVAAEPGGEATAALHGETQGAVEDGIAIEPPVYDFEAVHTEDEASADFVIRNTGPAPLSPLVVAIEGTDPAFSVSSHNCDVVLAPGDDCSATVTFAPIESEPGKKSASLVANSDSSQGTSLLRGHTMDYFVSPGGSDTQDGLSPGTAFKTITHALAEAEPGWSVRVGPGTFGPGEVFPLIIDDVRLFGNLSSKPTIETSSNPGGLLVKLVGNYPELHHVMLDVPYTSSVANPRVIVANPDMRAQIGNVQIQMSPQWTGLTADVSSLVTVEAFGVNIGCETSNAATRGIFVAGQVEAVLQGIVVDGCGIGLGIDESSSVFLRGSSFQNILRDAIQVVSSSAQVDLGVWDADGVTTEAGENVFEGTASMYVGLNVMADNAIDAHGNTWLADIQGADGQGHYPDGHYAQGPASEDGEAANFQLQGLDSEIFF